MCTALNTISKKVDEQLSLHPDHTPHHTTLAAGSACLCEMERDVECPPSWDSQGESTPHWPMYPISQIAFLLTPTTNGEVQCSTMEMAGRRRHKGSRGGQARLPGVSPSYT